MGAFDGTTKEAVQLLKKAFQSMMRMSEGTINSIIYKAQKIAAKIRSSENPEQACADVMDKSRKECIQALTAARDKGYLSEEQFNLCRSDVINMSKYNSIDGCAVRAASLDALKDHVNGLVKDADRGAVQANEFDKLPTVTKEFSETLTNARIPDGILENPSLMQKRIRSKQKNVSKLSHTKQSKIFGKKSVGKILSDAAEKAAAANAGRPQQRSSNDGAR